MQTEMDYSVPVQCISFSFFFRMSIITFQNLVPVALYLTVEGVKTIQVLALSLLNPS